MGDATTALERPARVASVVIRHPTGRLRRLPSRAVPAARPVPLASAVVELANAGADIAALGLPRPRLAAGRLAVRGLRT